MNLSPTVIIWWKEIRAVLPLWVGVLAAMWLPALLDFNPDWTSLEAIQMFTFLIGSAVLAAVVYAREFQDRTMIWQLLQPVSRMSVLWRKGAVLLVVLATVGSSFLFFQEPNHVGQYKDQLLSVGIFMLLALVSVCLWGLLLRNILAASVMALFAPVVLVLLCVPLMNQLVEFWQSQLTADAAFTQWVPGLVMTGFLSLYTLATGVGALFLWRRLQLPGDAVTVSQLDVQTTSRFTGDASYLKRTWWWTLVRKEGALLRFIFWVGVVFVVGGGAYLIAERLLDRMFAGPGVHGLDSLFWYYHNLHTWGRMLFSFHFALVPALCGALAFCEETHQGTRAWQLCQPAHRLGQWLIKLGVAAGLSAVFGLVLPLLVYLVAVPANSANLSREVLLQTVTLNVLLFSLSVWCASASRSTVMALMKTFLLVFGLFLVGQNVIGRYPLFAYSAFDWRLLAWPLSAIALAYTWPNFGRLEVSARRWVLQIGGMALLTFGFACGVALW